MITLKTMINSIWTSILVAILSTDWCWGYECYSCVHSPVATNKHCITSPWQQQSPSATVHCPDLCGIQVQTMKNTGKIYSIRRGCAEANNGCHDNNSTTQTCVTSCYGDLCNDQQYSVLPAPTKLKGERGIFLCWSCSHSFDYPNEACVNDPANAGGQNTWPCGDGPDDVCSVHIQYNQDEERLESLYRGCEPLAGRKDMCSETGNKLNCVTFCQDDDGCNDGNGVPPTWTSTYKPGGSVGTQPPGVSTTPSRASLKLVSVTLSWIIPVIWMNL